MLLVNDSIGISESEFSWTFTRSGGPGGQNVNKVNSRALLHWNPSASAGLPETVRLRFLEAWKKRLTKDGTILITSQRYRDQGRNMADCLNKLRDMILLVFDEPVKRRATQPSRGARQRRLSDKKATSDRKQSRRRPAAD